MVFQLETGRADDRAPNLEELQRLVENPDPRIKALVYTMASSGIRLGAWEFLRWKHITPEIDKETGQVVRSEDVGLCWTE